MSVRQRSWLGALLMALAVGGVVAAASDYAVFGAVLWISGPAFVAGFALVASAVRIVAREIGVSRGRLETSLRAEAERHRKPDA